MQRHCRLQRIYMVYSRVMEFCTLIIGSRFTDTVWAAGSSVRFVMLHVYYTGVLISS